jgi:NAD(P)-dependent dehydrogenase (short-subunit alcohol dehydrogenase family)
VDILVNGAGWGQTLPFWETTPDFSEKLIALNFVGPMRLAKNLLPKMMERGSGKIINTASDAGRFGKPSEIADAVVFFASDRASYITGQVPSVSGGLTMMD